MQPTDLSFVQYQILAKFITSHDLSFSQAKPENVSSDLYKYHLKHLIEKGQIIKAGQTYSLTTSGQQLVHLLNVSGLPEDLFQLSVLLVVTRDAPGGFQILAHTRTRQPYLGDTELVAGKVHHGEIVENSASRKLSTETGLSAMFSLCGLIRKLRFLPDNSLFQDTLYHVLSAHNPTGELIAKNEWGENTWLNRGDFFERFQKNMTYHITSENMIRDIVHHKTGLFYLTENVTLPDHFR
jgi:hypothetical protein